LHGWVVVLYVIFAESESPPGMPCKSRFKTMDVMKPRKVSSSDSCTKKCCSG
jgi:hypothetical protein